MLLLFMERDHERAAANMLFKDWTAELLRNNASKLIDFLLMNKLAFTTIWEIFHRTMKQLSFKLNIFNTKIHVLTSFL